MQLSYPIIAIQFQKYRRLIFPKYQTVKRSTFWLASYCLQTRFGNGYKPLLPNLTLTLVLALGSQTTPEVVYISAAHPVSNIIYTRNYSADCIVIPILYKIPVLPVILYQQMAQVLSLYTENTEYTARLVARIPRFSYIYTFMKEKLPLAFSFCSDPV